MQSRYVESAGRDAHCIADRTPSQSELEISLTPPSKLLLNLATRLHFEIDNRGTKPRRMRICSSTCPLPGGAEIDLM